MILRATALLLALVLSPGPAGGQRLPDLGDASGATLSETQERTIGNRIMREVRVDPAYVNDPDVVDYVNSLGSRLLAVADANSRRELSFFVVQDDAVNAFALVGGHIGIHTGLLLLTQNESELAGVMAHEIAHILQRHQARTFAGASRAQWASLAALALAVLASRGSTSQAGQMTEAAVATAGALQIQTQLDYTREHEREADRVGLTLLERAGYDVRGMASFFERMLRTNRLNEFKGAPSYLRTHPLTTERIADIQDRVVSMPGKMVPDTFEYRLARAKLRAAAGSPAQAVAFFRELLADATVLRPREDQFGLALALRRARDFDGAWKALEPLRKGASVHPAFEVLAAELHADQGRVEQALETYSAGLRSHPRHRGLTYGYLNQLLHAGRAPEVLADLEERLRGVQDDATLYEIQARAYAATSQRVAQHRAQAEAYFRRGNLAAAVDQLEIAVKDRGSDFYQLSSAESRLRELRALLENERAAEKALKIS
ncbi:MAG TPA: M48 family metalloprotease [Usitatibacter sp.]|nr:M48 family metalloprotease [Usitatibacter sp.]